MVNLGAGLTSLRISNETRRRRHIAIQLGRNPFNIVIARSEATWRSISLLLVDCRSRLASFAMTSLGVKQDVAVPDPAARAQADDVHGPSVVVDPHAYRWQHPEWSGRPWHEAAIYELHVGACGGFDGVRARLADLAALGVTAIELMPIADFPGARNWGYDGVLPYAPDAAYGPPDSLKAMIDHAHGLGLLVYLDVVYNHFGPDGNFLHAYASRFFRADRQTPWGAAIDFRQPVVRRFFIENAIYWLMEYRFDGLRFDAVHAIEGRDGFLAELAMEVRARVEPGRHVHLVLENDANEAAPLAAGFDAQWNDDGHHVLHHLLTGEADDYYADYATDPAKRLARCLAEGFVYQGEESSHRGGALRGTPSAHLPPTAFVLFLQNHDQIGNRPFGDRLTRLADGEALRVATALLLLAPQIPLLFMDQEIGSERPFLYFTAHGDELAAAVREGRAREFAAHTRRADGAPELPDPNAEETFARSCPDPAQRTNDPGRGWLEFHRRLLALRQREIVPRLAGATALGARALGDGAVVARWRMGDGAVLAIALNLGAEPVPFTLPAARELFTLGPAREAGALGPRSIAVTLGGDA